MPHARPSNDRPVDPAQEHGRFTSHTHAIGSASRAYKLYVPASYGEQPMPLILMLHGCKQNPDDFAAGTRMNELAEEHGFLVAYPAQTARDNGANCWNWFNRSEQTRDGEEPSLLAGIVEQIAASHRVDATRVYVAGLSAGASMAVILGVTHPEVFTAVGAHSGLPLGAAHDVPSAFAAMQGMRAGLPGQTPATPVNRRAVPTIVFHGDADTTVTASNGGDIVAQAVDAFGNGSGTTLMKHVLPKTADAGRASTTTRYVDAAGQARVERWDVHGGSHAWFGGSSAGSYTDATGPDASAEMVRFFLEQRA
ncbi:MAG: PHB depolymerase family esterase [Burkholderiaceae bacterium]